MRLTSLSVALAVLAQSLALVNAATAPYPVARAESAYIDSRALFVYDGQVDPADPGHPPFNFPMPGEPEPSMQFFSLDLSVAWSSPNLPWTNLTAGPMVEPPQFSNLALNQDASIVYGFDKDVYKYDVASKGAFTSTGINLAAKPPLPFASSAVLDPETGLIHGLVPVGQASPDWTASVFDPVANKATHGPVIGGPSPMSSIRTTFLSARKTVFVQTAMEDAIYYEYNVQTKTFSKLTTTGDIPARRLGACVEAVDGGKKVLLGGGSLAVGSGPSTVATTAKDIYILDLATAVWSKLVDAPLGFESGVCAVSNNQLLLWGGYSTAVFGGPYTLRGTPDTIDVLDLAKKTWSTSYVPGIATAPSTGGSGKKDAPGSGSVKTLASGTLVASALAAVVALVM